VNNVTEMKRKVAPVRGLLEDLMNTNGVLTPGSVVDAARDPKSPLHSYFEWDDTAAAELFRDRQARDLIRSVSITVHTPGPVLIRAFVSLPSDRKAGGGYRTIERVMDNKSMRHELANDILATVAKWEEKAAIIKAVVDFADTKKTARQLAK